MNFTRFPRVKNDGRPCQFEIRAFLVIPSEASARASSLSLSFLSLPPLSLPTSPFRALFLQWLFGGGVCLVIFGIMAVMSSCSVAASVACAARLDHIKVRIRLPLYHLTRLVK